MKTKYLIWTIALFIIELLIVQTNGFVRNTLGDFFAVILLYCLIRSFFSFKVSQAAIITLTMAFTIEFTQLSPLSESHIFKRFPIVKLLLGSTFSWEDIITYSSGITVVILIEKYYRHA